MFDPRHKHSELLLAIDAVGEVPCQRLPQVFFPEDLPDSELREKATATARELCADCPIMLLCRNYAIETGQEYGIWGGLTPDELTHHRRTL